jgi:N-acetylneuraminate synthase
LHDLYSKAFTPWEWHGELKKVADLAGIHFFSTPFDRTAVDLLENLGVPAYKVASYELVDIPLIEYIARLGKPMIISTGMATMEEIDEAVQSARSAGASEIALLKCTSLYPAPPEEMNLRAIRYLSEKFGVPVGISDHTVGIQVTLAAVALGACIVERHFMISRKEGGPDSSFSLEPLEFEAMVRGIRSIEKALGTEVYTVGSQEAKDRLYRRSLFAVMDIRSGETFTHENVRSIRPGAGLAPKHLKEILGKKAAKDVPRGTPLSWDQIQGS